MSNNKNQKEKSTINQLIDYFNEEEEEEENEEDVQNISINQAKEKEIELREKLNNNNYLPEFNIPGKKESLNENININQGNDDKIFTTLHSNRENSNFILYKEDEVKENNNNKSDEELVINSVSFKPKNSDGSDSSFEDNKNSFNGVKNNCYEINCVNDKNEIYNSANENKNNKKEKIKNYFNDKNENNKEFGIINDKNRKKNSQFINENNNNKFNIIPRTNKENIDNQLNNNSINKNSINVKIDRNKNILNENKNFLAQNIIDSNNSNSCNKNDDLINKINISTPEFNYIIPTINEIKLVQNYKINFEKNSNNTISKNEPLKNKESVYNNGVKEESSKSSKIYNTESDTLNLDEQTLEDEEDEFLCFERKRREIERIRKQKEALLEQLLLN